MSSEGHTPYDVGLVLEGGDFDAAIRCLELIRIRLPEILPDGDRIRCKVIRHCHHHPSNCYPALGFFGPDQPDDIFATSDVINAWAEAQGLERLLAESQHLPAPTWKELRGEM
jgi:hypothetical protein